jgi:hypothetical protein
VATYNASDITKSLPGIDEGAVYYGSVAPGVNTATGDVLNPCKLPAGLTVVAVQVNVRTAFASTAPAKIGIAHVDGSTPPQANPDTLLVPITDTSLATTGVKTLMPQAGPFTTQKDSYLQVVFGTVATPAQGVADFVAYGEFKGSL